MGRPAPGHFAVALFAFARLAVPLVATAENPVVRFTTPLGSYDVELCRESSPLCLGAAPGSVENFLRYVDDGDYAGAIVHRSVENSAEGQSVIQGGLFRLDEPEVVRVVPQDDPIANEWNQPNRRGTLGYSRVPGIVDSATSHWFVNVSDNLHLDGIDAGFTVFGVVTGNGMDVVDQIAALPTLELVVTQSGAVLIPDSLRPLFDPDGIAAFFIEVPFPQAFFDRVVGPEELPLPDPDEFAEAFITADVMRVPEADPLAGGLAAASAAAALAQRRRRRSRAPVRPREPSARVPAVPSRAGRARGLQRRRRHASCAARVHSPLAGCPASAGISIP
jgi:cyclophilin family peptidyl-prolyl cis-trans isomerase